MRATNEFDLDDVFLGVGWRPSGGRRVTHLMHRLAEIGLEVMMLAAEKAKEPVEAAIQRFKATRICESELT